VTKTSPTYKNTPPHTKKHTPDAGAQQKEMQNAFLRTTQGGVDPTKWSAFQRDRVHWYTCQSKKYCI